MKALKDMINSEKARLLHELFPDEMPKLLENLKKVCADFEEHKEEYTNNWNDGFIPFDYWFSLSQETANILKRFGSIWLKAAGYFPTSCFTLILHCLSMTALSNMRSM